MKSYLGILITSILSTLLLAISSLAFAEGNASIKPSGCLKLSVITVSSSIKLDSGNDCVKYIVKNGAHLRYKVFARSNSVILVEPGGVVSSEEDLYAIINQGGTVNVLDGSVKYLLANAGTTKITTEAEIENQLGSASVELDDSLKK